MKNLKIIFFISSICFAQSISKQIIGSAGNNFSNTNIKVNFSIGESVVGIMTYNGNQLSNGFHPGFNSEVLDLNDNLKSEQIIVFPNPTSKFLYVHHSKLNTFEAIILDINGKVLYSGNFQNDIPLDISNYMPGLYMVIIENKENNLKKTYKIIVK